MPGMGWTGCSAAEPQPETCDGADTDCDGEVDEANASDAQLWYADVDGDGFLDRDDPGCADDEDEESRHDDLQRQHLELQPLAGGRVEGPAGGRAPGTSR